MTVDEIYELIAVNIYNNIAVDNWEKAVLNIQGDNDAMGIDGCYVVNGTTFPLDVSKFQDDVEFALMDFHKITTEGGENIWNCAEFTLKPNGEFSIDLNWDSELEVL
ncbi:MAG: hypothetical protein IIV53_05360 [Bacteroidaceae bacterium]|nr:hypothetical protein [Bacteroidaceae bacterium]